MAQTLDVVFDFSHGRPRTTVTPNSFQPRVFAFRFRNNLGRIASVRLWLHGIAVLHKCYTVEVPCDKSYTRRGGSFVEALFTLASLHTHECTGANASRLARLVSKGKNTHFHTTLVNNYYYSFRFFFNNISQSRIIDEPVPYRSKSNVCVFVSVAGWMWKTVLFGWKENIIVQKKDINTTYYLHLSTENVNIVIRSTNFTWCRSCSESNHLWDGKYFDILIQCWKNKV